MPRFSVPFGRRKSGADNFENVAPAESSFRVLERSQVVPGKSFDGGAPPVAQRPQPKRSGSDVTVDDNIFAGLKSNRGSGSGSSNTTKTVSTDTSSRHSNVSTAPSTAEAGTEDWRTAQHKKMAGDAPLPPVPKSSSNGFLKAAGRTFSFGGQKKHHPPLPSTEEDEPPMPTAPEAFQPTYGRSRATTSSTATTITAPRLEGDFDLDLGGDFSKILLANEKRASVATVREEKDGRSNMGPRTVTGPKINHPAPIQIDNHAKVEAPPYSWSSHHSNDQLMGSTSHPASPMLNDDAPPVPPLPSHISSSSGMHSRPNVGSGPNLQKPTASAQRTSGEDDDEEAQLLRDSLSTVNKFMTGKGPASSSRYRRNDDEDSLFDTSHQYSLRSTNEYQRSSPQSTKVMTPAEFEKYRKDKERQSKDRQQDTFSTRSKIDDDDDDNYEEDDDDVEKAKQQAKQRRKQEAHMAVYRQQMMKVTGESVNVIPSSSSRPSLSISFSTPNLPSLGPAPSPDANTDNSDEDEEVPLAILAAHGFPTKQRAPTRLSTMGSNPNLRASQQPSYQRPVSTVGEAAASGGGRLPAFARNLPQDPFLGAGLVRNSVRESFALGGGSSLTGQAGGVVPPGGLVGVIASEERSRALRRGSPQIDAQNPVVGAVGYDPIGGIPPNMMYRSNTSPMQPADQAQINMAQQMQQFMQMQMQFMQMQLMGGNPGMGSPAGHMSAQSLGSFGPMGGMPGGGMPGQGRQPSMLGVPGGGGMGGNDMFRHSFVGNNDSLLDLPNSRGDAQMRTMSMVQPSSASWVQMPQPGFAPPVMVQGNGYAPSIAPSERSNIGLPGRYRPVSHMPPPNPAAQGHLRNVSTMSGALNPKTTPNKSASASDDDDEEGWEAMKAKRDKKKSLWSKKKSIGGDFASFLR
ncbi:hypothetical protein QBC39DRAFT_156321 [Podospora conica]|nr:hypothetical protein QBC39DRAFT_156321 [Schizothecium conicum]